MINQNLLLTGDDGYNLTNSLRFRSSASAYLNRTFGTPTSTTTWSLSFWLKRGNLTANAQVFSAGGDFIYFGGGTFTIKAVSGAVLETTQVFRDPSAWYHFLVVADTSNATANNRVRLYVNGTEVTAFSSRTNPSISAATIFNASSSNNRIGGTGSIEFYDGYLAETNFIDGQALTPNSFGTSNGLGVWQPIRYGGSYGTNGFYLPFTNTTSTTTLGFDFSPNGNNWTTNNISLTAGSTYDSMTDVPTLTSATAANYCVLNPLQLATPVLSYSLSNGNLQLNSNSGSTYNCFANGTIFPTTGKWYAEFQQTGGTRVFAGISRFTNIAAPNSWNSSSTYYINTGEIQKDGSTVVTGATWTTGDIIGVAYDADAATCAFYKNNVLQTTVTGVTAGTYSFSVNGYQSGVIVANFGQQPWVYTPPTGFVRLNTFNLPTPTIGATASTQAGKYMNVVTYTGTGSSLSVTGVGFQPDWTWIKGRSGATDHGLYDAVRGVQKQLESNTTDSETTETTGLTAFGSDGFTVGALAQLNTSSATYVGWNWKANGAGVTNTAGSITSTVSANTTAGFSVVTYTGNGTAGATVGHGLGVAPSMVIVKNRSAGSTNWCVYHVSVGNQYATLLNSTATPFSNSNYWNNTTPTSTVFSLGNGTDTNGNTNNLVAYCFAEVAGYSAFGSYTGNGSSDGTFVYTGFRPRFIIVKASSTAGYNWILFDTARSPTNVASAELYPNLSNAEGTDSSFDFLSNGFKLRVTSGNKNLNGTTYIYMAFAESPFKYANAR